MSSPRSRPECIEQIEPPPVPQLSLLCPISQCEISARALLEAPPLENSVSPHVNKALNDDPECIEPTEPPVPQLSLLCSISQYESARSSSRFRPLETGVAPMSPHVKKALNDDPKCIEPIEPPVPQLSLL